MTYNRIHKGKVRTKMMSRVHESRGTVKRYFCLPGDEGLCIKAGKDNKAFNSNTEIIGYERDFPIFEKARKLFEQDKELKIFKKRKMIFGEISDSKIDGTIDFAFLDYCGVLDMKELNWIERELGSHLEEGASVGVTMFYLPRKPPQIHLDAERFLPQYKVKMLERTVNGLATIPADIMLEDVYMARPLFLLCCALRKYQFDKVFIYRYKDIRPRHNPMMVIHFINLRKGKSVFPSLQDITEKGGNAVKKSEVDWAEAGRKSWITRRANARKRAKLLSKRAKKAWITRKNNSK